MTPSDHHISVYKSAVPFFIAIGILSIIGIWHRYIFADSNLPFLLLILIFAIIIFRIHGVAKDLIFNSITFFFLIFVFYMCVRMNNESILSYSRFPIYRGMPNNGFMDIAQQLIFCGLFILSAFLYYKKGRFSFTLWLIISGYILALMVRHSVPSQWIALKTGQNLIPGMNLFTLVPFVFFGCFAQRSKMRFLPHIIYFVCVLWVFALRARGPCLSLVVFYGCFIAWPIITRKRFNYFFTFFGSLILIFLLIFGYLTALRTVDGLCAINEISQQIFQKGIDSRFTIWNELMATIPGHLLFGFGTGCGSFSFAQTIAMSWRDNLASHSTYLELMLRLGIVGLILYFAIFFSIWRTFWIGRKELAVRVAGAFLISSLFFMSTAQYWIFIVPLKSGFGWIILGIGAGACLRAKRQQFRNRSAIVDHGKIPKTLGSNP